MGNELNSKYHWNKQVSKDDFLNKNFDQQFCSPNTMDYNNVSMEKREVVDFYSNPKAYKSDFMKFASAEFFIAGHYHAADSPLLFTRDDVKSKDFKIRTVADIS